MGSQGRMSPLSAFFLGLFGVGGVTIAGVTSIVLYGMRVIDKRSEAVFGIVESTVANLPDLVEQLPHALGDLFQDRRALDYTDNVEIAAKFLLDDRGDRMRPSLAITNKGSEVISLMAVRVAALNAQRSPVAEWTETVATPIGIADEWRGPLAPGATRYVLLHGVRGMSPAEVTTLIPVTEIPELRIWAPSGTAHDTN